MSANPDFSRVCERYARAAQSHARTDDQRRELAEDLTAIQEIIKSSPLLRQALTNPLARKDALQRILDPLRRPAPEGIGCRDHAWNLIRLLITNRRTPMLAGVVATCLDLLRQASGILSAEVTTARPLDSAQRDLLIGTLERLVPKGGSITVDEKIRPEILGGMILRLGSRRYDDSLLGKLNRLTTRMKQAEA